MSEVASRELRNDTAGVLRRAQAGEARTITGIGKPFARLTAVQPSRRRWLSGAELAQRHKRAQADPGLRRDLASLAGAAGVLDTSVFIANESGRPLDESLMAEEVATTVITVAELTAGVGTVAGPPR
jgi:prevent-host-death family protein